MKIGRHVLVIALGILAPQQSYAKAIHAHHGIGQAARSVPNDAPANGEPGKKGPTPADSHGNDAIDARSAALSPNSRAATDKTRNAAGPVKITVPANAHPHRQPAARTTDLVGRNAIGQPVVPRHGADVGRNDGGKSTPADPGPVSVRNVSGPNTRRTDPAAGIAVAGVSSVRPIHGTALIRPTLASSGLGGPAKFTSGINGTAFRTRP